MRAIYLDLDGVFADFSSAVSLLDYTTNPAKAWGIIDKVPHFFSTLDKLEGAKEFYDTLAGIKGVFLSVLTALPQRTNNLVTAAQDKRDWFAKNICPLIPVICTDGWAGKSFYAEPGAILIDDSLRNIEDWVANGGTGIHHTSIHNTLKELKYLGLV